MGIGFNKSFGWVVRKVAGAGGGSVFDKVIQWLSGGVIADQKTVITPLPIVSKRNVITTNGDNQFIRLYYYPFYDDVIEVYARFFIGPLGGIQYMGVNNVGLTHKMMFGITTDGKWSVTQVNKTTHSTVDADGDWHLFKYDNGALYVDDVLVADSSGTPSTLQSSVSFVIGAAYTYRSKVAVAWFRVNGIMKFNFEESSGTTVYSLDGSGVNGSLHGVIPYSSRDMRYMGEGDSWSLTHGCNTYAWFIGGEDVIDISTEMEDQPDVSNVTMEFNGLLTSDVGVFGGGQGDDYWFGYQKFDSSKISNLTGGAEFSADGGVTWSDDAIDLYRAVRRVGVYSITIRNLSFDAYTKLTLFKGTNKFFDGRVQSAKIDWNSSGEWDMILKPSNHAMVDTLNGKIYYNENSGDLLRTHVVPALYDKTLSMLNMSGTDTLTGLTGLTTSDVVTCDGTSTPTASSDRITFTAGTAYNISINGSLVYTCGEDVGKRLTILPSSNETWPDAIINGTLSNVWTARRASASGIMVDAIFNPIEINGSHLHNTCEVGLSQEGTQILDKIESPEGLLPYTGDHNSKPTFGYGVA